LNPDIPPVFLDYFWHWVLVFVLGIVVSLTVLVRVSLSAVTASGDEATAKLADRFPELAAAWREIEVRLGQARIQRGVRHAVVILAPNEDWAAQLITTAGVPLLVQAPDTAGPIHAFATAQAVLITATGASSFGTQEADGSARMAALGQLIRDWNPECPPLRSVVVVFPIRWAGQPDSIKWAAAVRDDLQALSTAVEVRCPVFAVFTEMESTPGFGEFLGRMPEIYKQGRCGFGVPASQKFGGELIQGGLDWMAGWFHGWAISLMAQNLPNCAANQHLFSVEQEFRRYRRRLRAIIESAISTHPTAEPVLFRGCYFAATGASADERAFASALLGCPHGRFQAEDRATCWTAQAADDDRGYRRVALAVGSIGALLSLLGWVSILLLSHNPWWSLGLFALLAFWAIVLFRLRQWSSPQLGSPIKMNPAQ
jgi:type VI secretion system protein ImpL